MRILLFFFFFEVFLTLADPYRKSLSVGINIKLSYKTPLDQSCSDDAEPHTGLALCKVLRTASVMQSSSDSFCFIAYYS